MRSLAIALGLVILIAAPAMRSEEAKTVSLAGRVVDSRMIVHRKVRATLFYLRMKVEIDRVDSGRESLQGIKTIEMRCWQENDGEGNYLGGHQPIPADGAAFGAVLIRHPEGFFEPASSNAITLNQTTGARRFPILTKASSPTGLVVGGIVGLLLLLGAGMLRYRGGGPKKDRSWSTPDA